MYKDLEKRFNVIYPESNNATYNSLLNYSEEATKTFQRWYRYKEGYSIDLVKNLISEYAKDECGIILDPFAGSGTTLLGACELGYEAVGFEVNPFSHFLATIKTRKHSVEIIKEFYNVYLNIIENSKIQKVEKELPILSISHKVFDENVRKIMMSVRYLIDEYSDNQEVKDLLLLGWLACLEELSNYRKAGNGLKMRKTVKPRIITNDDVYRKLINQFNIMYNDLIQNESQCRSTLYNTSCLNMSQYISSNTLTGIIFSPPYANCFDYTEIYKLELWFGDFVNEYSDLKKLRNKSLRSHLNGNLDENDLTILSNGYLEQILTKLESRKLWDKRIPKMLKLYFTDMYLLLKQCYVALKDNGFCSIIVSNSAYGGIIIPTDLIIADIAESLGFKVDKIFVDRYIITSSQQYEITSSNKKYLRESIICLTK